MDFDGHVDRIDALTRNARNTWFVLLGVLVFITITLMGVEDIDFYGVDRATKLPLVDVEVPTRLFFVAAPILAAAVYGYFHLYLIRLWDALGAAPAEHEGRKLGDAVTPWLVTDMALFLRPEARVARAMDVPAFLLNVGLAWVFGIAVLGWLWWESATGREVGTTLLAGVAFFVAGSSAYSSGRAMILVLKQGAPRGRVVAQENTLFLYHLIGAPLIVIISLARVWLPIEWVPLAKVDLAEARLVERPAGWLQYEHARREFQVKWCKREGKDCAALSEEDEETFAKEWRTRRQDQIDGLKKPGINGVSVTEYQNAEEESRRLSTEELARISARISRGAPNLTYADLRRGFLSGMNLTTARLRNANLREANLEGADLLGAQLQEADLRGAQLQDANLSGAQLQDADLFKAQLQGAKLKGARLLNADLSGAQLRDADLSATYMQGANFSNSRMYKANLRYSQMQGAEFLEAHLRKADFSAADLSNSTLKSAHLENATLVGINLENADLQYATLQGADLTSAWLTRSFLNAVNFEGAVLKGANLARASLVSAKLINADLADAQLEGASLVMADIKSSNLNKSKMDRANFTLALFEHVDFGYAELRSTVWNYSLLIGTHDRNNLRSRADFSGSTNRFGAVRNVDFSKVKFDTRTDWRNAFMDGSVKGESFKRISGRAETTPCQWIEAEIERDEDFFAIWRWWAAIERYDLWRAIAPEAQRTTLPATPALRAKYGIPEDCKPQTGPLKTFPGPHGP